MVHIKNKQGFRIYAPEFIEYPLLPALAEIELGVHILSEEAILVRNAEKIEDGGDHIEVGNQDGLRHVLGEIDIRHRDASPEFGDGFTQHLGVDLLEMRADLEPLVDL